MPCTKLSLSRLYDVVRRTSSPGVRGDDVFQGGREDHLVLLLRLLHDLFQDTWDIEEVDRPIQQQLHGPLVRRGENGGHRTTPASSLEGKGDAWVLLQIGLAEGELAILALALPPIVEVAAVPGVGQVRRYA